MINFPNKFAICKSMQLKLLTVLSVLAAATVVQAEPYLAFRTGFKCSQCHMNRIGGGERTEFGSVYTQTSLPMPKLQDYIQSLGGQTSFDPKLNESVTLGGNFRVEEQSIQKYSYTDNTGKAVINRHEQAVITEANLYLNVDLLKNFLSVYTDQTISSGGTNMREMYGMARGLPLNSYVKVGHTLLPYGIRLMDDNAFIRSKTGYTYNRHDLAAEIGLEPGPVSLTANLTNTQFSSVGSLVFRHFRLGGSFGNSMVDARQYTFGPFLGANFGRLTVMGEMDVMKHPDKLQRAEFLELDVLAMQGVNVKATYEYFDNNVHIDNKFDGQERWTFGVEPFLARFLQVGLYYRLNRLYPQAITENQDVLTGRVQVFF